MFVYVYFLFIATVDLSFIRSRYNPVLSETHCQPCQERLLDMDFEEMETFDAYSRSCGTTKPVKAIRALGDDEASSKPPKAKAKAKAKAGTSSANRASSGSRRSAGATDAVAKPAQAKAKKQAKGGASIIVPKVMDLSLQEDAARAEQAVPLSNLMVTLTTTLADHEDSYRKLMQNDAHRPIARTARDRRTLAKIMLNEETLTDELISQMRGLIKGDEFLATVVELSEEVELGTGPCLKREVHGASRWNDPSLHSLECRVSRISNQIRQGMIIAAAYNQVLLDYHSYLKQKEKSEKDQILCLLFVFVFVYTLSVDSG